jgi:23S rRNA (adenine1618-N6)-methyltransferase
MPEEKREHPEEKLSLHPRNKHRERYDFKTLINTDSELRQFVKPNVYNDDTIDFFDPKAVIALNKALLKHYYEIEYWDIPEGFLCPPIPGRADYIHHIADLLAKNNNGLVPTGNKIKCLDIGVGANCIYPIIGIKEYGWSFVGTDVDPVSVESAKKIIDLNPSLNDKIEIRLQSNQKDIFAGIIDSGEKFDLTICNPPFHSSAKEAKLAALKKLRNLRQKNVTKPKLNFGGQNNELWCEGGEEGFVRRMINQSTSFADSCLWFSTLLSKETNLKTTYHSLKNAQAAEVVTLPMAQGNKISRIVAWTFLSKEQQNEWVEKWK